MAQAGSKDAAAQSTPPRPQQPPEPPPTSGDDSAAADRLRELESENARLREQLAAAGKAVAAKPTEPSFKFSEGQRDELERTGRTVSPFTGKRYVGTPDKAREATAEEFAKAKPAEKK